jgi:hypothetical protein
MRIQTFTTQKAAMRFAHHFLLLGRQVKIKRRPLGNWEVRVFAR